jgi:RimJ/RimL family protein N-acetyltransferase
VEVPPILSERLELVSMSPDFMEAVLDGRHTEAAALLGLQTPEGWAERQAGFLRLRLRQMQRDPSTQPWLARAITLRRDERPFLGFAGFHGPPGVNALGREDAVELGYRVEVAYRRRGYATETVEALMRWARDERGVRAFIASVAPDNEPSLAIVRKLGFRHVGEHWDEEDGRELEFVLESEGGGADAGRGAAALSRSGADTA